MKIRSIAAIGAAVIALATSGCGLVEQAKEHAKTLPTETLGANIPSIPTSIALPSLNDLSGGVLEQNGFKPNADKTEYTRGAAVIVMRPGQAPTMRLTYPQGIIECPPDVVALASLGSSVDGLLGLGYDGVLNKHKAVCKPVAQPSK